MNTPPPLLTQEEQNMLDSVATMQLMDPEQARVLMFLLPFKNRSWKAACAICNFTMFPLDSFSKAVASRKLFEASRRVYG